jgi:hypothetical protein
MVLIFVNIRPAIAVESKPEVERITFLLYINFIFCTDRQIKFFFIFTLPGW